MQLYFTHDQQPTFMAEITTLFYADKACPPGAHHRGYFTGTIFIGLQFLNELQ